MKQLFLLLSLCVFSKPPATLLVVDKDLKKPARYTTEFTSELYLKRNFPVYATETAILAAAATKAAKELEAGSPCPLSSTLTAAHTRLLVSSDCNDYRKISVTLVTEVAETNTSYSFVLVRDEESIRHVQRKLLDLATYLNP